VGSSQLTPHSGQRMAESAACAVAVGSHAEMAVLPPAAMEREACEGEVAEPLLFAAAQRGPSLTRSTSCNCSRGQPRLWLVHCRVAATKASGAVRAPSQMRSGSVGRWLQRHQLPQVLQSSDQVRYEQ